MCYVYSQITNCNLRITAHKIMNVLSDHNSKLTIPKNMKKGLTFIAFTVMMVGVYAQNGFNMPLSQFGFGQQGCYGNFSFASGMGDNSYVRASSGWINPFNPASYAAIEQESFVLDIGLKIELKNLENRNSKMHDADGSLDHIVIAFPIFKWWKMSLGLLPYGDVSYQSTLAQNIAIPNSSSMQEVKTVYDGSGEISCLYWGNGFNIGKHWSVGFNVDYLYGSIDRAITYKHTANDTSFFMDSRNQNSMKIRSFTFNVGARYETALSEHYDLAVGASFGIPQNLTVRERQQIYTFVTQGTSEYLCQYILPEDGGNLETKRTIQNPLYAGLGISLTRNKRWLIELNATYTQQDLAFSPFVEKRPESDLVSYMNWAIGVARLGDKEATSYWNRIDCSIGAHYNPSELICDIYAGGSQQKAYHFDEWGVGMGFGFPMRRGKSHMSLLLGYSSFGSIDVLRSNCFTIGLSLNSCERWFVKRKYN